jgi:hypothetical protein
MPTEDKMTIRLMGRQRNNLVRKPRRKQRGRTHVPVGYLPSVPR